MGAVVGLGPAAAAVRFAGMTRGRRIIPGEEPPRIRGMRGADFFVLSRAPDIEWGGMRFRFQLQFDRDAVAQVIAEGLAVCGCVNLHAPILRMGSITGKG